jgi:predicted PurR-regulated permease PerM
VAEDVPQPVAAWREQFPPIRYWAKVGVIIIGIIVTMRMLAILQGVLMVLAASSVLAIGLQPAIGWFERRGTPRALALALIMVGGIAMAVGAGMLIVPVVVEQVRALVDTLPEYLAGLERDSPLFAELSRRVGSGGGGSVEVPEGAVSVLGGVAATVFDLVLVLTLTPYFALAMPRTKRWAVRLLVRQDREEFMRLLNRSTALMGNYIAGNLLVSVIAGVITYVGLVLIGIPYAAALAVFVAVTDLVPAVGATIGAAAVVAVAATQGIPQLLWSIVLTVGYQQLENFVIVPHVMREAIDVTPALGIVALLVGATLAGPVGALLALPVTAMIKLVLEEFVLRERMQQVRALDAEEERTRTGGRTRPARRRALP